jgi:hypothetical protein
MPIPPLRLIKTLSTSSICDTECWGKGKAKTVQDLYKEVLADECYFRICRVVEIVGLNIVHPTLPKRLIEVGCYLPDGRWQERGRRPSETKTPSESLAACVARAMREEFSITENYTSSLLETKEENASSKSYPGLPCLYIIHEFEVKLNSECAMSAHQDQFETREPDGTRLVFKWEE